MIPYNQIIYICILYWCWYYNRWLIRVYWCMICILAYYICACSWMLPAIQQDQQVPRAYPRKDTKWPWAPDQERQDHFNLRAIQLRSKISPLKGCTILDESIKTVWENIKHVTKILGCVNDAFKGPQRLPWPKIDGTLLAENVPSTIFGSPMASANNWNLLEPYE